MEAVKLNKEERLLEVKWKDQGDVDKDGKKLLAGGDISRYPYVWLRDSCQCSSCFHHVAKMRLLHLHQVDPDVIVTSAQIDETGGHLKVEWDDGHSGTFDVNWLKSRHLPQTSGQQTQDKRGPLAPRLWGSELQGHIPTLSFHEVLTDDLALLNFIRALEVDGICLLKGAPTEQGQIYKLGERVAYLKRTSYGETFTVRTKSEPSNVAYTSSALMLHTDYPYAHYVPGIQMLHVIRQIRSDGGDNYFCDGFHVANQLREMDAESFHLLTTLNVNFYDIANDFISSEFFYNRPTIQLDRDGKVTRISFNNHARDNHMNIPVQKVHQFYKALRAFHDLLHHSSNTVQLKLSDGDVICFQNDRVLHGRRGFESMGVGDERHLEGGYLDMDEVRSRRRVLESSFNANKI